MYYDNEAIRGEVSIVAGSRAGPGSVLENTSVVLVCRYEATDSLGPRQSTLAWKKVYLHPRIELKEGDNTYKVSFGQRCSAPPHRAFLAILLLAFHSHARTHSPFHPPAHKFLAE